MIKIIITFILSAAVFFAAGIYISRSYTKNELDNAFRAVNTDLDLLKRKVFPEAAKLAEKEKCTVDLNTMKCK